MKTFLKISKGILIVLAVLMIISLLLVCIGMMLQVLLDMLGIVKFGEPFF